MLPVAPDSQGQQRDAADELVRMTVEACVKPSSSAKLKARVRLSRLMSEWSRLGCREVDQQVRAFLSTRNLVYQEAPIPLLGLDSAYLTEHLQSLILTDAFPSKQTPTGAQLLFWQVHLDVRVFRLHSTGPTDAEAAPDEAPPYQEWDLPAAEFHGIWPSLIYDTDIKATLLAYATTALLFSDRGVDPQLVSFNRTVLLHGPPGTGKTSICKALAQRLAIKFASRWSHCQLIEVNAHSLFSKWFSESGKQVAGLFERIWEELEDDQSLVFVLIDEVESLTAARQAALAGGEPSDSIRAVNALLTHLDRLRACPNVLILATSNLAAAVDAAFIDRADIKAYIGPPGPQGRYAILRSSLVELQRAGLIGPGHLAPSMPGTCTAEACMGLQDLQLDISPAAPSKLLEQAALASEGLSGRALRKLPLLAFAELCQEQSMHRAQQIPLELFIQQLVVATQQEQQARQRLLQC